MVKEITSKDNKTIKYCKNLQQKKLRDKTGQFLIEGVKPLEEAINLGFSMDYIFVREDMWEHLNEKGNSVFMKLLEKERTYKVSRHIFQSISQTENSQGLLAIIKKIDYSKEQIISKISPKANILILDKVQDPGNLGTLIRTSEGAGYEAIISIKGTGDIFAPKTVRATGGSIFRMPFLFLENYEELMEFLKDLNKKAVVTAPLGEEYYYDADLKENIGLIVGNEGNGVDEKLIEKADLRVKIPMKGNLESLNVAVAGALVMYEALRK